MTKRVLVVDDDKESLDSLSAFVTEEGHTVTTAQDAESALHRIRAWKPHLILLDVNMPGTSGLDLIPRIRSLTADDYVSVILVSASLTLEEVSKALDLGADDYLSKPFRATELLTRVRTMLRFKELQDSLKRSQQRVEELSTHDELTGLLNMRALLRRGEEEVMRCRRFRKPISALLVNVDQFSSINENADFLFGNYILKEVGALIKRAVRSVDMVARLGGDEYFVILPETDLAGAEYVAQRIRDMMTSAEFKSEKHSAKATSCIGIAGFNNEHQGTGITELFRNSNESLKTAKIGGTNRIEIYSFS